MGLTKHRLFGILAMSLGLITKEQLDECLAIQEQSTARNPLGAILLAQGYMSEKQVREILAIQSKTKKKPGTSASTARRKKLLGEILVERGHIDRQTLENVLQRQRLLRQNGLMSRLGELLLAIGKITNDQLAEALTMQKTG